MRVSCEGRNIMWNEKHNVYGWNLDRQQSEIKEANPCKKCKHFTEEFPYCKLPAIQSTTCSCDGKLKYYSEAD